MYSVSAAVRDRQKAASVGASVRQWGQGPVTLWERTLLPNLSSIRNLSRPPLLFSSTHVLIHAASAASAACPPQPRTTQAVHSLMPLLARMSTNRPCHLKILSYLVQGHGATYTGKVRALSAASPYISFITMTHQIPLSNQVSLYKLYAVEGVCFQTARC